MSEGREVTRLTEVACTESFSGSGQRRTTVEAEGKDY